MLFWELEDEDGVAQGWRGAVEGGAEVVGSQRTVTERAPAIQLNTGH